VDVGTSGHGGENSGSWLNRELGRGEIKFE
jgi:hypothetical protein